MANPFNGAKWPKVTVYAAVGAEGDANAIVLDSGPGLGTGTLGGVDLAAITTDSDGNNALRSVRRSFGRGSPIDAADIGTCQLVFNNQSGDYDPTNAGGPHAGLLTIGTAVQVVAEWPLNMAWPRFTGTITSFEIDTSIAPTVTITCADALEQLGRTQLPLEAPEFADNTSGQRVHNILDRAGWPTTARAVAAGYSTLHATVLGNPALEELRKVEATETGLLFVSETGDVVFYDRHQAATASRSAAVQLRLADAAPTPYVGMTELVMVRSRDRVYNDIRLTREPDPAQDPELAGTEPGDEPQEQAASDAASIAAYGNLNLPAAMGALHVSDTAVLAQAQGLLARHKDATDQISSVAINALHPQVAAQSLWPDLLALTLLDRIEVSRDYGPNTIAAELLVQGVTEEIAADPPTWTLTLTTANPPPDPTFFYLDIGELGTDMLTW
jgi:hypothetical protein